MYTEKKTATSDGQKVFEIDLETFVETADTVLVQAGMLMLLPDEDFTVSGHTITLTEGVHKGCTVGVYIFKQIEHTDVNYFISGVMIEPNSMPLDRLAEQKVFIKHDTTGELYRLGLDDNGLYVVKQE